MQTPVMVDRAGSPVCFTKVTSQLYYWTMSVPSETLASWLDGGYSSGSIDSSEESGRRAIENDWRPTK